MMPHDRGRLTIGYRWGWDREPINLGWRSDAPGRSMCDPTGVTGFLDVPRGLARLPGAPPPAPAERIPRRVVAAVAVLRRLAVAGAEVVAVPEARISDDGRNADDRRHDELL